MYLDLLFLLCVHFFPTQHIDLSIISLSILYSYLLFPDLLISLLMQNVISLFGPWVRAFAHWSAHVLCVCTQCSCHCANDQKQR